MKVKRFFSWLLEWIEWCLLTVLWYIDWLLFPFGWIINFMMDFNGRPPFKPSSWNDFNIVMDDIESRKNKK